MSRKTSLGKPFKVLTDYVFAPRDWSREQVRRWYGGENATEIHDREVRVASLLDRTLIDGEKLTLAEIIEREDFEKEDLPIVLG